MAKETTSERLGAIERRLDLLEGRRAAPAEVSADDQFWALNTLKGLVEEPGALLFTGTVTPAEGEHFDWQEGKLLDQLLAQDWSELAASLAALAHPVRLSLVQDVLTGKRTASELSADERFGTSGQLYHHLRQLVSAGWLKSTGRGHYSVPPQRVVPLLVILMGADR
ncbi:MAG: helix-turn-helix domain-containing protein [Streptosporangiales bacterium]|nr:helix-turn-helix domain-containing protein [Streptosporangiales bacterium]